MDFERFASEFVPKVRFLTVETLKPNGNWLLNATSKALQP